MDIRIHPVTAEDADALAHVLVTAEEHAFRGLVPDQCLTFTEAESSANWQRFLTEGVPPEDHFIVAENPQEGVVGYAWGGPNTKDAVYHAELRQIAVLTAYQGRGIGRLLVCHVARYLAKRQSHSLRVEVLQVNPNRQFYERLGATFVSEYPYNWDGVVLPMSVYGWADTHALWIDGCAG
ncbi:MAG: GNAT family N-acetyltransferase [Anaerolineae bacterium]|nr:GNAT family N-acetyltransferase [Anaerolineae bacterium]